MKAIFEDDFVQNSTKGGSRVYHLKISRKNIPWKIVKSFFWIYSLLYKIFIKFALVIFMEYRLEFGIVDSGVLSDNFIEF